MQPVEELLAEKILKAVAALLGTPWMEGVSVEVSNRPELGDYASSVAFAVSKVARRAPLQIATALAETLAADGDLIADATAAAPGFLNLRLSTKYLESVVQAAHDSVGRIADSDVGRGHKVLIEHTNINPNKAAHIGHFRNACLGDSVARVLARLGYMVEVQNYIDDTGVQVADVVVGLRHLDEIGVAPQGDRPFDRWCSEVYVAVQQAYADKPELAEERTKVQHAIERGEGELAEYAHGVAERNARANLATMARAGITYDLLTWESAILRLGFWQHAFAQLKAAGVIHEAADGPNAGCWVVPFGAGTVTLEGKTVSEDKVLVTSKGIATYTAKDIAYQLWKFGLLGLDFGYVRWDAQSDGRPLWSATAAVTDSDAAAPRFAHANHVINVIDVKQSYLQQVVYECLRRMAFTDAANHSEHLSYAVVTLSPAAAQELGLEVDAQATSVAMSGRKGIQVLADDLLDKLAVRVRERAADDATAHAVAVGAARYYMLKFSNNQPIAFDFEDALRTTGETGVYLQYAYVRASGILRRVAEAAGGDESGGASGGGVGDGESGSTSAANLAGASGGGSMGDSRAAGNRAFGAAPAPDVLPEHDRALVLKLAEYPRILAGAGAERAIQMIAKYAFELATAFSTFYDNTPPMLQEQDPALRAWRVGLVAAFRMVLADVLHQLGIPTVERI